MREILFRGKCKGTGEWVQGDYEHFVLETDGSVVSIISQWGVFTENVVNETVGQFTGLTDKNGNKIFEGDILGVGTVSGYVLFKSGYFVFCWKNNDKHRPDFYKDCILTNYGRFNELEVISNIHDNPELMTARK